MVDIKIGSVISGSRWSEPVLVNSLKSVGDHLNVVGITRHSRQLVNCLIPISEVPAITILNETTNTKRGD